MSGHPSKEAVQIRPTLLDELEAEAVAREIFESVLAWQRRHNTCRKVACKMIMQKDKVVKAAPDGELLVGEVAQVGLAVDGIRNKRVFCAFEFFDGVADPQLWSSSTTISPIQGTGAR